MPLVKEYKRMSTQHRTILCYLLLSLWIFLLIAGMQRYIAGNWVQQTNVNLNTKIYLRNEINFNVRQQQSNEAQGQGQFLGLLGQNDSFKSSFEQRLCNPTHGIRVGQEGGIVKGWKLQGIIAVTRHGDRGPMVHVRDANSVDCGVPAKENPFLDGYKTFLVNNTLNTSLNHMTWLKMGSFHGFPLFPITPKQCQLAQLTQQGIAQHLQLGTILRTAYADALGLGHREVTASSSSSAAGQPQNTPNLISAEDVVVFSTRYRRTFQSAMALLYGLLPLDKWLAMNVRDSHSLTFCFSDCACPKGDTLKGQVNGALDREQQKVRSLVKFMEERLLQSPGNRYHALGLRDALLAFVCHNVKIPCETDGQGLGGAGGAINEEEKRRRESDLDIINIDQDVMAVPGVNSPSEDDKTVIEDENDDGNGDIINTFTDQGTCIQDHHVDQLMRFTDALLLKIRQNPEMRSISLLRAYGFMRNIVNYMLKMISGSNLKVVLYSGHDLTIQYLLSALGLNSKEFIDIPYATRTIFEVYKSERDVGQFYFRVVYNGRDVTRHVIVCEGGKSLRMMRGGIGRGQKQEYVDLCPIENIIRYIHDDYFAPLNASNFKDACFASKY